MREGERERVNMEWQEFFETSKPAVTESLKSSYNYRKRIQICEFLENIILKPPRSLLLEGESRSWELLGRDDRHGDLPRNRQEPE